MIGTMEDKDSLGGNTAVMDRPDTLPATPPEQALVTPKDVAVSQRIIDDINSLVPEDTTLTVKKEQWANDQRTLTHSTVLGDARMATTLSGVPTQPNFETPNIPQGMVASRRESITTQPERTDVNSVGSTFETSPKAVSLESPHTRIRKETLQKLSGMTLDQQLGEVKAALASYDAEVGMGKDQAGREVSHEVYQREYRRLRQNLLNSVVQSALESNGQEIDQAVLGNPTLMQEVGQNEALRRMVITEAGKRIDTTASDSVDAAYQKQHLLAGIYGRAGTADTKGGVTKSWADRAIRGEQRGFVLGLLSTPESTHQAVSRAKEWLLTENTDPNEPVDVKQAKLSLAKAILRIQKEKEKTAAKLATLPSAPAAGEPIVDNTAIVEPVVPTDLQDLRPPVSPTAEDLVSMRGEAGMESIDPVRAPQVGEKVRKLMEEKPLPDGPGATEKTRRFGKRLATGLAGLGLAVMLVQGVRAPDRDHSIEPQLDITQQGQDFTPGEPGGGDPGPGLQEPEIIGSGQPTTRPETAPDVEMTTPVTFDSDPSTSPVGTWGEEFTGIDGSTQEGKQAIAAFVNNRENLDLIEATVLANLGEEGMPTDSSEVRKMFDEIREGTRSQSDGWHLLDNVVAIGTAKDYTYNKVTQAGVQAMHDNRDGVYGDVYVKEGKAAFSSSDKGEGNIAVGGASNESVAGTSASGIPDFTVTGADGNPVRVTVGDGTGGPEPESAPVTVQAGTGGVAAVGDVTAVPPASGSDLGKPPRVSWRERIFGRRG